MIMKTAKLILFSGCLLILSACGLLDTADVNVGNGQVESFVEDVSSELGIGPTQTPTPSEAATATPTKTPKPQNPKSICIKL